MVFGVQSYPLTRWLPKIPWMVNLPGHVPRPRTRPCYRLINNWFPLISPFNKALFLAGGTLGGGVGWPIIKDSVHDHFKTQQMTTSNWGLKRPTVWQCPRNPVIFSADNWGVQSPSKGMVLKVALQLHRRWLDRDGDHRISYSFVQNKAGPNFIHNPMPFHAMSAVLWPLHVKINNLGIHTPPASCVFLKVIVWTNFPSHVIDEGSQPKWVQLKNHCLSKKLLTLW